MVSRSVLSVGIETVAGFMAKIPELAPQPTGAVAKESAFVKSWHLNQSKDRIGLRG